MTATQTTGDLGAHDVVVTGAGNAKLMPALRLRRPEWRLRIALVSACRRGRSSGPGRARPSAQGPSVFAKPVSDTYGAPTLAQRAKQRLRPFSFSSFRYGIAIARAGIGLLSYPDNGQSMFIIGGIPAHHLCDFSTRRVSYALKPERGAPGAFFRSWPGRGWVPWS